jgi:phage shock protein A
MLNELRRVFRQSVAAFRAELGTREPEDEVAELLTAMRRELVAARAAIPEYEARVTRTRAELERERDALTQCERRGTLAEGIGDPETARIAAEFAARHRARIGVLEQTAAAAAAELDLRVREADEMKARYQQADANRFALLAELRRVGRARRLRTLADDDETTAAWSRMEEKVERDAAFVDALDDLDESPPGGVEDPGAIEERLRELKRRLGRD